MIVLSKILQASFSNFTFAFCYVGGKIEGDLVLYVYNIMDKTELLLLVAIVLK